MLVRLSVAVDSAELAEQLEASLSELDASLQVHPLKGNFWEHAASPSDILLVSFERLPRPAIDSVESLCALPGSPRLVVLARKEDAELHAQLLTAGATGVLNITLAQNTWVEALEAVIERAREQIEERIQAELDQPRALLSDFRSQSPSMQRFMQLVSRVATADSSLLILGDTGVGKERLARAIHEESPRCDGPFVPVNCAAFPEALLEGELFGHEEGAFTGAIGDRRGYFELAHGGTLFLDEIGEVHRYVQVKLLRVLQERMIQRLGGEVQVPIDVRIMAATNRNLKKEIAEGRFRRDLYYRLSVVTLDVPSLKEHPEDIPALLDKYLIEFRQSLGRPVEGFSEEALDALFHYEWPGNVRELINVVERSVLLCAGQQIELSDLPLDIAHALSEQSTLPMLPSPARQPQGSSAPAWLPTDWQSLPWAQVRKLLVSACEREYLHAQLTQTVGRVGAVAKRSGLSNRAVHQMMKRLDIHKESYKSDSPITDKP